MFRPEKMTKLALILALLNVCIVALCQNYGTPLSEATARLQQLKVANANISHISANFTTTITTPLLTAPQYGAGLLTYNRAADRLALSYTQPMGDELVIERGTISITSAGQTVKASGGSTEQVLSMFKACLTGNFDKLTQKSDVEYYESASLFRMARIHYGNGESTEYEYTNQKITKN